VSVMAKNKGAARPTSVFQKQKQKGGVQKGGVKKAPRQTLPKGGIKGKGPAMQRKGIMMKQVQVKPAASQGRHTVLLQQPTAANGSRTWADFASVTEALDFFVNGYEAQLRRLNPATKALTYSVADLHLYVDSMADVSLLVADPQTKQYAPRGKDFLKSQLLQRLKSAAK